MKQNKLMLAFAFMLIASMLITACQPQTIIQTVEVTKEVKVVETQVVEKLVESTKLVEQTKVVEVEVSKKSFTTPHPILGDLKVRQAMATCTNKPDLARAGYPLITEEEAKGLVMDTMIPKAHWAYAGDANVTIYPFSVEKGKALLAEAGWKDTDEDGIADKDGKTLTVKFATTTAAFRQAWAAVWEKQMAECGIQILRSHVPSTWWFGDTTGLQVRDFELGAYAWVGEADPGGQTLWACDQIPTVENNFVGQNYMGWCNKAADEAIKNAVNSLVKEDRIKWYKILQQEYTKDVPAIPVFNRTENAATAVGLTGFGLEPGQRDYTYNVNEWEIPGKDTIVLGFTQEPASLHTLVESAWVTSLAASMMSPYNWTSQNYDFKPWSLKALPTIESGLAKNNDVDVKEGDMVLDAAGNPVKLAAGMKVRDNTGAEVEYKSGTIKMKQLVVKFQWLPMKWQDGSDVGQADFELGYKTQCDKESGATSFISCDKTAKIEFAPDGYTWTPLPGVQDALYFQPPFGYYPSNQPIESNAAYKGKTLKDVPAKDWPTLVEVAEKPWSNGPYIMKEWVKGEKMVFEANQYYFKGAPKTKNIVISFVSPENAESQLLGGQVDTLGSESFGGLTEQIVAAAKAGKIKTYVIAGATWEHIDINMFLK